MISAKEKETFYPGKADHLIQKMEVSIDMCTLLLPFLQALLDDPELPRKQQ
jgi:hypothetical protein